MAGRRLAVILLAGSGLVVAAGLVLWRYGPAIAVEMAIDALEARGIGPVTTGAQSFTDGRLVITDLRIGDVGPTASDDGTAAAGGSGLSADNLSLGFTLDALRAGRLTDARIGHLTLRLVEGAPGPFAALLEDNPAEGAATTGPASPLALPIDNLVIDRLDAAYLDTGGNAVMRYDGRADIAGDDGLAIALDGRGAWAAADGSADIAGPIALTAQLAPPKPGQPEQIAIAGTIALEGGGDGWSMAYAAPVPIAAAVTRSLTDGGLTATVPDCLALPAIRLGEGRDATAIGNARLCATDGEPLLRMMPDGAAILSAVLRDAAVTSPGLQASLTALTLTGPIPGLAADDAGPLALTLEGGRMTLADAGVTLRDIAGTATATELATANPQARIASLSLRVDDTAQPQRVVPLAITLAGTASPSAVALKGRLTDAAGRIGGPVTITHDPAGGRGHATLALGPVNWARGSLQPVDIAPVVAGLFSGVTGQTAAHLRADWRPNRPMALRAVIDIVATGVTVDAASLSGIDGQIVLTGPDPWVTTGPQTLEIGRVDAGIQLTGGTVTANLTPKTIDLLEATWPFAGGRLSVQPTTLPRADGPRRLTVKAEALELSLLAALAEQPALTADGRISGTIPVVIAEDGIRIDKAVLAGRTGRLSWTSDAAASAAGSAGEGADLLARALQDFRVERLNMTLDGPLEGELVAGLSLAGSSPAVYDGYPMEINLDVRGPLAQLLSAEGRLFDASGAGLGIEGLTPQ
ncbi:YdbH domain-containing protein [Tistrella bauzanensis]|uniref:intermembrane phospholipid transport protein YdbH family protein n=1 Tax=Tistrella TaxID=171436 RepID=UPI0031F5FAFA